VLFYLFMFINYYYYLLFRHLAILFNGLVSRNTGSTPLIGSKVIRDRASDGSVWSEKGPRISPTPEPDQSCVRSEVDQMLCIQLLVLFINSLCKIKLSNQIKNDQNRGFIRLDCLVVYSLVNMG